MSSLVLELQRDALNNNVRTSDLLRKALVVARKLKIKDIDQWITCEMNGYSGDYEIPKYRKLFGELKVHNPYRGWIPFIIQDERLARSLTSRSTSQSISELEKLSSADDGTCYMKFPHNVEQRLYSFMEIQMEPALLISTSQINGVIEKARNAVLEWALSLEENGIIGEGMSFSEKDKKTAINSTYNIKNLIGSMTDSQIQQDSDHSSQSSSKGIDIESIRPIINELLERIKELRLGAAQESELMSEINCINTQLDSPKPKVTVIKECIASCRNIIEGASGSALFQGILSSLETFS